MDPRSKELGARLIINLEKLYLSLKKLGLEISEVDEYYNHSHLLGFPKLTQNIYKIKFLELNVILRNWMGLILEKDVMLDKKILRN